MAGFHLGFSEGSWIGILIFGSLCWLLIIASLSFTIYQFNYNEKMRKISRTVRWCSWLALTCFALALLFNHLYIICVKLPTGNVTKVTQILWAIYNSLWSLGYFFTYMLFYERLRATFQNTEHALTKLASFVFFALLICFMVSQQAISILWAVYVLGGIDNSDWRAFNAMWGPALWTKFIIDFILNIYIIYLFCSKIFKVTVEKTRKESMRNAHKSTSSFRNGEHSFKIFETMIKYFLLTFLTVISTQIFTASEITLSAAINHAVETDKFQFYYTTYIFTFIFGCTDSMVSTVYIMLTFPFAKEWYGKFCNGLHGKCVQLWGKCALKLEPLEIEVNTHSSFAAHKQSLQSSNLSMERVTVQSTPEPADVTETHVDSTPEPLTKVQSYTS